MVPEPAEATGAFLEALPSSTALTRAAKFNEQNVSSALKETGLTHTNINVLLSFERESWSKYVNVEFLKGMCACLFPLAWMTSPKAERDWLMFCASFKACPYNPGFISK